MWVLNIGKALNRRKIQRRVQHKKNYFNLMKQNYEKNELAYQDDAYFERERRNIFDIRNQHRELMSQKYYQISDNDPDTYFEVTFIEIMI